MSRTFLAGLVVLSLAGCAAQPRYVYDEPGDYYTDYPAYAADGGYYPAYRGGYYAYYDVDWAYGFPTYAPWGRTYWNPYYDTAYWWSSQPSHRPERDRQSAARDEAANAAILQQGPRGSRQGGGASLQSRVADSRFGPGSSRADYYGAPRGAPWALNADTQRDTDVTRSVNRLPIRDTFGTRRYAGEGSIAARGAMPRDAAPARAPSFSPARATTPSASRGNVNISPPPARNRSEDGR